MLSTKAGTLYNSSMQSIPYVMLFSDIDTRDTKLATRKSRDIAEMIQAGFPMIPGFLLTSAAYFDFLKENKLDHKISQLLTTTNFERPESVMQITNHITKMFSECQLSPTFHNALQPYFEKLGANAVTMHAYTHGKDMVKHLETIATNYDSLADKVKDTWSAHFSGSLLTRRNEHAHNQVETGMEIIIQQIIQPKKAGPFQNKSNVELEFRNIVTCVQIRNFANSNNFSQSTTCNICFTF